MCFADDLVLFSKGDYDSVTLLLRGFATFSQSSGLEANTAKLEIFACNVDNNLLNNIVQASGMGFGKLPMKYLGVPISTKRLCVADCDILVDKMMSKIKTWGSKNLSYAGRTILVNSILMSMHVYWASIFILPQAVIHKITAICRNFLWGRSPIYKKPPLVAWEENCKPKCNGGLGIRDCYTWNKAAIGKYVWFVASKADMLWVKWVHSIYLKRSEWWTHTPKSSSSWSWRKICACRDMLKAGYHGNSCMGNAKNVYSISSGYKWCLGQMQKVHWDWWVWNRINQPKHSFMAWLVVKGSIQTRTKLHKHGICDSVDCPLCEQDEETIDHLFYTCKYSNKCLYHLQEWLQVKLPDLNHIRMMRWVQRQKQFNNYARQIIAASLNALLYNIWKARNEAVWNHKVPLPSLLSKRIRQEVYMRIKSLMSPGHRKQQSTVDSLIK